MATDERKEWQCGECGKIFLETGILQKPNPFFITRWIQACPFCREVIGAPAIEICDEPGCTKEATIGYPVDDEFYGGYRRTCRDHRDA